MGISEDIFGEFQDPDTGKKIPVKRYTLTSPSGVTVQVISYGAGITAVTAPDNKGKKDHVILNFDKFEDYTKVNYQGSTIGRHGNRIGKGKMCIDGEQYQLSINNNTNHLHGGTRGWDKYVWESCVGGNHVVFSHVSPDGDQGYPGTVLAQVKYALDDDGGLHIDYEAMTTKATTINMTNHSFFNLAGHASGQEGVFEHIAKINADRYIPVSDDLIPTGEIAPVGGTGFDLRSGVKFQEALGTVTGGFDHTFCILEKCRGVLEFAASFYHPPSGRQLEVYTTEPGVQFYTGNFLPKESGKLVGRDGTSYMFQGAFCCEPQNFPDSVNQINFPNGIHHPGKNYRHSICYKFSVVND